MICDLGNEGVLSIELNKMWQALYPFYLHSLDSGGLPLHATFVELNGKGFAIAAPGGTGKSTCSTRIPPPWRSISDDEILVVCDASGNYHAHPLPTWNNFLGKGDQRRWKTERAAPLGGIFFLDKAPEDAAEPLERARAAVLLYDAAMYKYRFAMAGAAQEEIRAERGALFGSTCDAAQRIASFTLRVSLHGKFWEEMENVLKVEEVSVEGNPVFKG